MRSFVKKDSILKIRGNSLKKNLRKRNARYRQTYHARRLNKPR